MKRTFLIILLLGIIVPLSEAQLWKLKRVELTGGLGTSTFFGDVGGFSHGENSWGLKDITFLQTRDNVNFGVKYRISQVFTARLSLSYGLLHATDARGSNKGRGYEASTSIFEPMLMGEYYFIKNRAETSYLFNKGRGRGMIRLIKSLDAYAFTGIGGLSYSVTPNELLAKNPLYVHSGFTGVVPVGVGANLSAYPNLKFGIELGFRYSFTDNLDGYPSQYSSANDVYYFFNLAVTYRLKIKKSILRSFR
jgi:Domain of unknown function (DUF6089)